MSVTIDSHLVESLFPGILTETLVFACAPALKPLVTLSVNAKEVIEVSWTGPATRDDIIDLFRRGRAGAALLLIDSEFKHFAPQELGPARIAGWSFFSSTPTEDSVREAVEVTRATDYAEQLNIEQRFLQHMDAADHLVLTDRILACRAQVTHQNCENWFSLNGPLREGQQTVLPTGEFSILADESGSFSDQLIPIDGEVLLYGEVLVHRGSETITREAARSAYELMKPLSLDPAVAEIVGGKIERVRPARKGRENGVTALETLFGGDDRYRKVHELGFGSNLACRPLRRSNFFGDERHPGLHFGLGLGGFLDFHFDIVCPDSTVLAAVDGREVDVMRDVGLQ